MLVDSFLYTSETEEKKYYIDNGEEERQKRK